MEMTTADFDALCSLVRNHSGIRIARGKEALVRSRLGTRLRDLNLTTMAGYLEYLRAGAHEEEIPKLVEAISTNVTRFFRHPRQCVYLHSTLLPRLASSSGDQRRLRIWSAGCSSGEEPYSIAIHLCEGLPDSHLWDARILATDISAGMLKHARRGLYAGKQLDSVPGSLLSRYFERFAEGPAPRYRICERARRLVTFARLNLMGSWPMRGPFDAIFCCNVMIYFDGLTQQRLVERYRRLLAPGGALLVGSAESLRESRSGFRQVEPMIYEKR